MAPVCAVVCLADIPLYRCHSDEWHYSPHDAGELKVCMPTPRALYLSSPPSSPICSRRSDFLCAHTAESVARSNNDSCPHSEGDARWARQGNPAGRDRRRAWRCAYSSAVGTVIVLGVRLNRPCVCTGRTNDDCNTIGLRVLRYAAESRND